MLNTDIIRGKNIMERFISSKGKEKNLTTDALKANPGGSFKPKKARKMGYQWGKIKSLASSNVDPTNLDIHNSSQGVRGNGAWSTKPPDQQSLSTMPSIHCTEDKQNESPRKGLEPKGK